MKITSVCSTETEKLLLHFWHSFYARGIWQTFLAYCLRLATLFLISCLFVVNSILIHATIQIAYSKSVELSTRLQGGPPPPPPPKKNNP